MNKKIVFGLLKIVAGLMVSLPLALGLEIVTGVRTPGAKVAQFLAGHIDTGPPPIGYTVQIIFLTDVLFCFAVLCVVYAFWSRGHRAGRQRNGMHGSQRFLLPTIAVIILSAVTSLHSQQPILQIVSPANLTQVAPGQTIIINVQADPSVHAVSIIAENPLPSVNTTPNPNQFTLTIPAKITPSLCTITTAGIGPDQKLVTSDSVTLDIELPDDPVILYEIGGSRAYPVPPSQMNFHAINDELPIQIMGIYRNSAQVNLTESTKVSYVSQNPEIASVSAGPGMRVVKAIAPGETSIVVTAGSASLTFNVTVPPPKPSVPPPVVSYADPDSGTPGVTQVTIYGSNFGATQGSGRVLLGTASATSIASWSDTQIVATVPKGSVRGAVAVTQNGVSGNSIPFSVLVPSISSIDPPSGSADTEVRIFGAYFGDTQGDSIVRFNRTPAQVTSWSAGSIVTKVPATATTGKIVLIVNGSPSNAVSFTIPVPQNPQPAALSVPPSGGYGGGSAGLSATLTSVGNPLNGKTVFFAIDGNLVGSGTTGADGVATVTASLATVSVGSHTVTASFAADNVYDSTSETGTLTVGRWMQVPRSHWYAEGTS